MTIRLSDGTLLIKDRRLTGFSNEEEKLAELDKHVPFMTQTELEKRGANYEKAAQPWLAYAVADGNLVTGQNPASGGKVGEMVVTALRGRQ
ncbi:hypothetical protein D3C72_2320040 [compost metagenome]